VRDERLAVLAPLLAVRVGGERVRLADERAQRTL
jgi:hypothetical protein